MRQEDQFQTSFCFFKKALYEVKAIVVCNLVLISLDSPHLGIQ